MLLKNTVHFLCAIKNKCIPSISSFIISHSLHWHCRQFPLTDLLKDTVKRQEYPRINSLCSAVKTLKYIMAASAQPPSDARPRLARAARCPPPSARTRPARVNQSDQSWNLFSRVDRSDHVNSCQLSVTMQSVTFNLCTPIAAVCC